MKTPIRTTILGVLLSAGVVQAQTAGSAPETPPASSTTTTTTTTTTQPAPSGPQFQAEIVSVDAAAKTVTARNSEATDAASAAPATLRVEGTAVSRLGFVKAGDRVTLICSAPAASSTSSSAAPASGSVTSATSSTATSSTAPSSSTTASASTSPAAGGSASADTSASATTTTGSAGAEKATASTSTDTTGSTTTTATVTAPSATGLNATCGSVVEIAKARPATTTPQQ